MDEAEGTTGVVFKAWIHLQSSLVLHIERGEGDLRKQGMFVSLKAEL